MGVESSNKTERRSTTPQPQQAQQQQQHNVQVSSQSHISIGDVADHVHDKLVESPLTDPQSQRGGSPLSLDPLRTPSPKPFPSQSAPSQDGTFANFQLPNDILKNLTPIIKSPPKDKTKQHIRKQAYMRNAQLKISARNNRVEKQVRNWKRQQHEFIQYQSARLTELLQQAKIRREEYLKMVREKAVRFVKNEARRHIAGESDQGLLSLLLQTRSSESTFCFVEQDAITQASLVYLSRWSKKVLFQKHVAFLRNSSFLDKHESMPLNETLSIFNTDSSIKLSIAYVLNYFWIIANKFELRMFLYCFIMVADFNDCMINGPHPGFNYNLEIKTKDQEKSNTTKNCIWVMLYKLTTCLLQEFKRVINTTPQILQKFRKYWTDYKFMFKIFKWNHFIGIKHLLSSSISIVEEQLSRISNDDHLYHQKTKLNSEMSLLNKYNLVALREFNQSAEVAQFTKLISNTVEELYTNFDAKPPSFIQNQPNFICFDLLKFHIPDFIPISKWRLYWMDVFFKEFESNRLHPAKLKTGYLGEVQSKTRNIDYINWVDTLMNMDAFSLQQTYEILYDYYLEFSGVFSLSGLVEGGDDLQKVQNLIRHYDKKNKLVQFTRLDLDNDEVLQLKYSVVIMWLQKSQFNKFDDFINFENLYTIINLKNFKNLRYSIYTQNPSLLFPEFYKLVMKFCTLDVETQLQNIVYASFKNNLNNLFRGKTTFSQEAFRLFNCIFNQMVVQKEFDNELSITFKDKLSYYHETLNSHVKMNSISLMFHSFTGGHLPRKCLKEAVKNLHVLANGQFVAYYENHGEKICNILFTKWQTIMGKVAEGSIAMTDLDNRLQSVFPEYTQDILLLSLEITKSNQFFYKLYMPILNWIYADLKPNGGQS